MYPYDDQWFLSKKDSVQSLSIASIARYQDLSWLQLRFWYFVAKWVHNSRSPLSLHFGGGEFNILQRLFPLLVNAFWNVCSTLKFVGLKISNLPLHYSRKCVKFCSATDSLSILFFFWKQIKELQVLNSFPLSSITSLRVRPKTLSLLGQRLSLLLT